MSNHLKELESIVAHVRLYGPLRILKGREIAEMRDGDATCPVLEVPVSKPELDHDHAGGKVRGTLQGEANSMIGKCENIYKTLVHSKTNLSLPDVLRNIADYLESDYSENPLHPTHRRVLRKRFCSLLKANQERLLEELGVDGSFSNAKERSDAFIAAILTTDEKQDV